jgi:hypothetical protein
MTIEHPTIPPGVINEDRVLYFRRKAAAEQAPKANIETRLALIAAERGISEKQLEEFRSRRANSKKFDYFAFADKHHVSLDWLLDGDLKGLLETERAGRR